LFGGERDPVSASLRPHHHGAMPRAQPGEPIDLRDACPPAQSPFARGAQVLAVPSLTLPKVRTGEQRRVARDAGKRLRGVCGWTFAGEQPRSNAAARFVEVRSMCSMTAVCCCLRDLVARSYALRRGESNGWNVQDG
jgi:hypothetical protein